MAATVNRKYGVAVANGTAALEIAVQALGIGPGDEVIMPTFTIISCAAAVIRVGAKPIFVDCDAQTWNIDVTQIEKVITNRTKALMVVHIYGLPSNMDPILDLAKEYGLRVIEDAAEMHGQTYKGKPCGDFGDISIFSFYPNKHVTTGEGGMVLTDDEKLAERCRSLRNLCFNPTRRFVHEELGFNYRMTNLQAAIGLAQLEQLDEFVERKRAMGKIYSELLADTRGIQLPVEKTDYARNIYWVFPVVLLDEVGIEADQMRMLLQEKGIGTRPFFWPMHEQPIIKKMGLVQKEKMPNAEYIARRGFYLPSGLALTHDQMIRSAEAVKQILMEVCS